MTKRGNDLETSRNNALAYLIHQTLQAKKEKKYQYDPSEVIANFDYEQLINTLKHSTFYAPKQVLADFNAGNIDKLEALKRITDSNSPRIPQYISSLKKIEEVKNQVKQDECQVEGTGLDSASLLVSSGFEKSWILCWNCDVVYSR